MTLCCQDYGHTRTIVKRSALSQVHDSPVGVENLGVVSWDFSMLPNPMPLNYVAYKRLTDDGISYASKVESGGIGSMLCAALTVLSKPKGPWLSNHTEIIL